MRSCLYPGSFDPPTKGHTWMIRQGVKLFDHLIVGIGTNPEKNYTFTEKERAEILGEICSDFTSKVGIMIFSNEYAVSFAQKTHSLYLLRGLRGTGDYEFERNMRHINSDLFPEITSVFLIPPRDLSEVSSSFVKGLIGPRGWEEVIERYVPPPSFRALLQKYRERAPS